MLQLPRFLLVLIVIYVVLSAVWRVDVAEFVTALGVGSLVIALALQDTLSNLFSGLLLLLNRPFQVGDWIRTGDVEGRVTEVNWRNSFVRTRDNDLIVIPNGSMAKSSFKNYSRPTRLHRVSEEFAFHIENPPNRVRRVLEETALSTPGVLADPPPDARTIGYEGISVRYKIFFWIEDYGPVAHVRNRYMTRVYYHAKRHGLTWPTPQRELFLFDGPTRQSERQVDTVQRASVLAGLAPFAGLSPESREALAGAAEVQVYGQQEDIVTIGEKEPGIYVLIQGNVSIAIVTARGEMHEILNLSSGDIFGETGLFGRTVSPVQATALTDVEVLMVPRDAMSGVIGKDPGFAGELAALIEGRARAIRRAQARDGEGEARVAANGRAGAQA